MVKKRLSFSICIPVWKGSKWLEITLNSLFQQEELDKIEYEVIIGDDNPPEWIDEINRTQEIIRSFKNNHIRYEKNLKNLGYPKNLKKIVSRATKDIVFLLSQDDILSKNAIKRTHDAFLIEKDIGIVTRPYFWFIEDFRKPVRAIFPINKNIDTIVSILEDKDKVLTVFESIGQLSGLAYRKKFLATPFNDDIFTAHIYPFLGIFTDHKCVFLKDYTVAARIESSQTISVSSIYDISPLETWINMFKTVLEDKRFEKIRQFGINNISSHYVGLLQLRNYAKLTSYFRELYNYIKFRPKNLVDPRFWALTLFALITPRPIIILLITLFKTKFNARLIPKIEFYI